MIATSELIEETEQVGQILHTIETVAMVGISKDQHKVSHYVGRHLKNAGYAIVPVNPTAETTLGEQAYPDRSSIPHRVDVVNIFRKPKEVPIVVGEAIETDAPVIWLQLGTELHPSLKALVEERGRLSFKTDV